MKKSPAFQFYPDEWLTDRDVMLMTPEQEGGYIRLVCLCWLDNDLSLPSDDDELSVLSRISKGGISKVKAKFKEHPTKPGFLTHSRLQKEASKQAAWREKSSAGGKQASENKKKSKGGKKLVEPKAYSPSPSPKVEDTKVSSPPTPKGDAVSGVFKMPDGTELLFDQLFERYWHNYPAIRDKGHKGKAKEELSKKMNKGFKYEIIGRGITRYREYCDRTGEKQPDFFRWIRDEGYLRDYTLPAIDAPKHGRASDNSLESALSKALADRTHQPDISPERRKELGLDHDTSDV